MYIIKIKANTYYSRATSSCETRSFNNAACFIAPGAAIERAKAVIQAKGYPLVRIEEVLANNATNGDVAIVIDEQINRTLLKRNVRIEQI